MESAPQLTHIPAEEGPRPLEVKGLEQDIRPVLSIEKNIGKEVGPTSNEHDRVKVVPAAELPAPVKVVSSPVLATASTADADDGSLVASDDDLIEKEWVTRAKKIVEATKEDPFLQGEEVGKLRVEYMKKRYGNGSGLDT